MFVKLTRINESNQKMELVVDTNEIVFVSESKPHYHYDKPVAFAKETDPATGEEYEYATEFESEPRYVIAFKNGRHPQFIDKDNYDTLVNILMSK